MQEHAITFPSPTLRTDDSSNAIPFPSATLRTDDSSQQDLRGWKGLLVTLAGPLIMGAVLGLPAGAAGILREGLMLPAVVFGVAALMAPALYIGMSLVGVSPPAGEVARAFAESLRACGTVLAGLAPATAFLLATADGDWAVWVFGIAAVASAALLGVRRLFNELRTEEASLLRSLPLYLTWALVSLGLGLHFFLQTLDT